MTSTTVGLPDPIAAGDTLTKLDPTEQALFVMIFVIVALMGFIAWREFSLVGLRRSIDKLSEALWMLRLSMIEDKQGKAEEDE